MNHQIKPDALGSTVFTVSLIFLVSFSLFSNAQTEKDFKDLFKGAESVFMYNKDYEMALPLYLMMRDLDPGNANIQYKIGVCYLNTPGREERAIPFLLRASKHITRNYTYSYKERQAPYDVYFYLGSVNHLLNNLDSALFYYQFFRHKIDNENLYMLDFVDQQIKNCRYAMEMEKQPVKFREEPLGSLINSYQQNLYPVISGDGKTLAYTAKSGINNRILVSELTKKKWAAPHDITDAIKAGEDVHTSSLSYDGKTLLLYKEDGGWADLYVSRLKNNQWSEIERLGRNINTKYWEANGCFSKDGKTLYFSSNRKGGFGDLDIYRSSLRQDGTWGKPVNLGPEINTSLMDDAPYITFNGKRLYFVSQGHINMGGFDAFYVEKKSRGWSQPVNLGYPVNTTDDNVFYCPMNGGISGLLSHFGGSGDKTRSEIFKIDFPMKFKSRLVQVEGVVTMEGGMAFRDTTLLVELRDSAARKVLAFQHPDTITGKYKFSVEPGTYKLIIKGDEFETKEVNLTVPAAGNNQPLVVTTNLEPAGQGKGDLFYLRPVFFEKGKSELTREAELTLRRLANIMIEHPNLNFEITGSTNLQGEGSSLQELSARRAQAVVHYFAGLGLDESRFKTRSTKAIQAVRMDNSKETSILKAGRYEQRVDIRLIGSGATLPIEHEIALPDYLKNNKALTYSILVIKVKEKLPPDYFFRYNMEELTYVKVNEVDGEYLYTLGSFEQKSKAVEVLGKLYSVGFNDARIYDDHEMSDILKKPGGIEKSFAGKTQQLDGPVVYTVQVYALYNPPYKGAFKGLEKVRVTPGIDKFFRYTTGEYEGYPAAYKAMEHIRSLGYHDAFIRPVSDLEKLRKK